MAGRYSVLGLLGEGGQGRVLAVRDAARGGAVLALKETHGGGGVDLRREFELLARLRHPNLAAVHDWYPRSPLAPADVERAPAAYTQDKVEGRDLWSALREASAERRSAVIEQVLRALAHLHAVGVVHLDLKPDNVIVAEGASPAVHVLDFGIARVAGSSDGTVRGSASYIAPERLAGQAAEPRADLYALGVMVAELWLGAPPAPAALRGELASAADRRRWLSDKGVPPGWLEFTTALTAADPAQRPDTVQEAAALLSVGLGRSLVLHTPGTTAAVIRAGRPVGRAAEQAACARAAAEGGARVLTGPAGIGRRTLALAAVREAQLSGHAAEVWPGVPGARTVAGLASALERLVGGRLGLDQPLEAPGEEPGRAARYRQQLERRARDALTRLTRATAPAAAGGRAGPEAAAKQDASPTLRPLLAVLDLEAAPLVARLFIEEAVRAAERGATLPLALVVTADRWEGPAAVPLSPLDRDEVVAMVEARLGEGVAPASLGASLAAASGGHPGTLEALLGVMVARGELRFGRGGWLGPEDGQVKPLPARLSDAVVERVRLLSPSTGQVLRAAAWLRFPATAEAVAAALDLPGRPAVEAALAELEASGLIWADGGGRVRVAHPAVGEATGAWTPPGPERAAHLRVLAGGRPEGLAEAWHLGPGEGTELALALAQRAWEAGQLERAAEGAALAEELSPRSTSALSMRAAVADLLGPREVQIRSLERLIEASADAPVARLEAQARLFWALTRTADAEQAERTGREVIAGAEAMGRVDILAAALVDLANVLIQRGDYGGGEVLLGRAEALVDAAEDPGLGARIQNNLGNIHAYRRAPELALACYTRAHGLKLRERDPVGQRIALGNMGLICLQLGRSSEALSHFTDSLRAARSLGHKRGEAFCLAGLGLLGMDAGALLYADRRLRAAEAVAEGLGDSLVRSDVITSRAELALARGDRVEARALAEQGLALAESVESAYTAAGAKAVLAAAWLQDEPEVALGLAREAAAAEAVGEPYRAGALRVQAEVALRRGALDEAERAAREALRVAGERPDVRIFATAERVLSLVGSAHEVEEIRARARAQVQARAATWPGAPWADGVDEESAADGPSRASYLARRGVQAWLSGDVGAVGGEGVRVSGVRTGGDVDDRGDRAWLLEVAGASRDAYQRLLGRWLAELVQLSGAERGFVLDAAGAVVAARDADGDPVADPGSKVPTAAAEEAGRLGAPWHGVGSAGRGSVFAVPMTCGAGEDRLEATLVLQNRFAGEAFAGLLAKGPDVTRGLLCLRLLRLANAAGSAQRRAEEAEAARREGATRSTEEILKLRRELESTREQLGPDNPYPEIIYGSAPMRRMLRLVDRVVASDLPVFIHGESGTGKELVARALHHHGPRVLGPFVAQNVSAIPSTLFESELFGHERGAFTGADRPAEGLFRRASGGTLFLDEVGDLPAELQAKLLRVLETGEVRPVGGRETFKVDVRVVSATHQDLQALVREGRFREDLFYRLHVVRIEVPPLRERPDDIPVLVQHFLSGGGAASGRAPSLGPGVMKRLIAYDWPGNVRQLENEVTRAALMADGTIEVADLSPEVQGSVRGRRGAARGGGGLAELGLGSGTLRERTDRLEELALRDALERAGGNKSEVARQLGISRAGLNMKLKRLGLWED